MPFPAYTLNITFFDVLTPVLVEILLFELFIRTISIKKITPIIILTNIGKFGVLLLLFPTLHNNNIYQDQSIYYFIFIVLSGFIILFIAFKKTLMNDLSQEQVVLYSFILSFISTSVWFILFPENYPYLFISKLSS